MVDGLVIYIQQKAKDAAEQWMQQHNGQAAPAHDAVTAPTSFMPFTMTASIVR